MGFAALNPSYGPSHGFTGKITGIFYFLCYSELLMSFSFLYEMPCYFKNREEQGILLFEDGKTAPVRNGFLMNGDLNITIICDCDYLTAAAGYAAAHGTVG